MIWNQRAASFALQQLHPVQLQLSRNFRKPRWLPIAKTKLFRIPVRPQITPEESDELKRIHNHYRTQMKAVRRYFSAEHILETNSLANIHSEKYLQEEEVELQRCFAINDEWNKNVADERNVYLKARREARAEEILNKMTAYETKNEIQFQQAELKIKEQINISHTFITLENLDKAIDECLMNPIDYNFGIDLQGNYYHGRKTNPENVTLDAFEE